MNFTFQAELLALSSSLKWRVSEVQRYNGASGQMLLLALDTFDLAGYIKGESHFTIALFIGIFVALLVARLILLITI